MKTNPVLDQKQWSPQNMMYDKLDNTGFSGKQLQEYHCILTDGIKSYPSITMSVESSNGRQDNVVAYNDAVYICLFN